jgi:hypothetical protein
VTRAEPAVILAAVGVGSKRHPRCLAPGYAFSAPSAAMVEPFRAGGRVPASQARCLAPGVRPNSQSAAGMAARGGTAKLFATGDRESMRTNGGPGVLERYDLKGAR